MYTSANWDYFFLFVSFIIFYNFTIYISAIYGGILLCGFRINLQFLIVSNGGIE